MLVRAFATGRAEEDAAGPVIVPHTGEGLHSALSLGHPMNPGLQQGLPENEATATISTVKYVLLFARC